MSDLNRLLVAIVAAGLMATGCDEEREVEYTGTLPNGQEYQAEFEVESDEDRSGDEFEIEREIEGEIHAGADEREIDVEYEIEGDAEEIEGEKTVALEAEGDGYEWESVTRGDLDTEDGQLVYEESTVTESEGFEDEGFEDNEIESAVLGDSEDRAAVRDQAAADFDADAGSSWDSTGESDEPTVDTKVSAMEKDAEGLAAGAGTGATSEGDAVAASDSDLDWEEATRTDEESAGSRPTELAGRDDTLVTPEGWQTEEELDDYIASQTEAEPVPEFEEPLEVEVLRDNDAARVAVLGDAETREAPEPEPVQPLDRAGDGSIQPEMEDSPYTVSDNDDRSGTTPLGVGFIVGGGVNDYVGQLDESTHPGGNWEARAILGTRTVVGGEVAYHGTANPLDTLGVEDGAMLVTNGAEGALRVNFLTESVQPYVVGGVGWKHFNVTNTDTNTSAVRNSDDAMTVPVGAGVAYRVNNIHADIRGMYRPAFLADIVDDAVDDDTNLDTISGSVNVGFEF